MSEVVAALVFGEQIEDVAAELSELFGGPLGAVAEQLLELTESSFVMQRSDLLVFSSAHELAALTEVVRDSRLALDSLHYDETSRTATMSVWRPDLTTAQFRRWCGCIWRRRCMGREFLLRMCGVEQLNVRGERTTLRYVPIGGIELAASNELELLTYAGVVVAAVIHRVYVELSDVANVNSTVRFESFCFGWIGRPDPSIWQRHPEGWYSRLSA